MNRQNLLAGVAESASYNIILQVFLRIETFLLNGFILRYISQDVLGIINVRILLLYSTITFLSNEAFKNACITNPNYKKWQQVINLIWLTVPTCVLCSLILGYIWINVLEQPEHLWRHQYITAVVVVGISTVIERLADPFFLVAHVFLFNKLKALVQCFSIASQSIVLAIFVYYKPEYAIYGFCLGQLSRSLIWVAMYYAYFIRYLQKNSVGTMKSISDFFPRRIKDQPSLSAEHAALTYSFFKQGILKQILTEGERYMMTIFNILDFGEQGVYDVVSNLGSMAARLLFRPIEESEYQFFAQTIERNKPLNKQKQASVLFAADVLRHLLQVMLLIGMIILTFGYPYSKLLLHIYGGPVLSEGAGPILLRWHCVYVLFIAINGVTECYTFATMSKRDIDRFNFIMLFISSSFLGAAWYLTRLYGGVGFILANCANMGLRIIHSIYFINKSFSNTSYRPLRGLILHPAVATVLLTSFAITSMSENAFCCSRGLFYNLFHIGVGAVCLGCVLGTVLLFEQQLVQFVLRTWNKEKYDKESDFLDKLD